MVYIDGWGLAVDNQGNMALGYSATRTTVRADIRYADD